MFVNVFLLVFACYMNGWFGLQICVKQFFLNIILHVRIQN